MSNLGPQFIKDSYQNLVQLTSSNALQKGDGTSISNISVTSSWAINALTASFVNTSSTNAFVQGGNSFGATALLGTNDTQDLQLETSGSVRIHISSSGRVGIGTTTPSTTLQVAGTSSLQHIIFDTNNIYDIGTITTRARKIWSNGIIAAQTSFFTSAVMYNNARIGGEHTATALLHISGSDSAQMMRINSPTNANILFVSGSGNVGIGTGTPTNTLQVVGGITATSITASIISASSGITGSLLGTSSWAQSASNSINAQTASFLPVGTYQITSSWAVSASQALTASFVDTASTNAFVQNGNSFGTTALLGTNDNQNLQLETSGSVRMTISSSGNVGIGTSNPLSLLHITASSGNEFLRITSGSQNILNVRSGSAVFFAGTGVASNSGVDLDVQGTGTANGGSVRFAANGSSWAFGSVSSVNRTGTIATDMFNVTLGGTSATLIQNPMKIQFDATQNATSGSGYIVLRVNATHATTAGTGSKLLQTWEFGGVQRSVVNITGSIGVGITAPSASVHISSSLGLPPMLTITPHDPLPTTNIPTGTFMVSASVPPHPYMWDGTSWYAL